MTKFIVTDSEYTTFPGALESDWTAEEWMHKEIVQIAAAKVDLRKDFNDVVVFETLVIPKINPNLSDLFIQLTGVTQERLDAEGIDFVRAAKDFADFCENGALPIVCTNGDTKVWLENCDIHGIDYPFDKEFLRLRPFLEAAGIDMNVNSSGTLHVLTDHPLEGGQVHNARHDVISMGRYIRHVLENGELASLEDLPRGIPARDLRSLDI